mmetsp:Transcript_76150/g.226963  ORF Transcript_76150/g.226963 Transcript_76150/m.226963 type:complete len:204 (-) Transcript_76150:149-760(-)
MADSSPMPHAMRLQALGSLELVPLAHVFPYVQLANVCVAKPQALDLVAGGLLGRHYREHAVCQLPGRTPACLRGRLPRALLERGVDLLQEHAAGRISQPTLHEQAEGEPVRLPGADLEDPWTVVEAGEREDVSAGKAKSVEPCQAPYPHIRLRRRTCGDTNRRNPGSAVLDPDTDNVLRRRTAVTQTVEHAKHVPIARQRSWP